MRIPSRPGPPPVHPQNSRLHLNALKTLLQVFAMGITFRFDREKGLLLTTAEGAITYDDIYAHLVDERKACGLSWPEIIDARAATAFVTSGEVRALVWLLHSLGETNAIGSTAFVVGTPVAFGLIRMAGMWCGNMCAIAPFWTREEAEDWIAKGSPVDLPTP